MELLSLEGARCAGKLHTRTRTHARLSGEPRTHIYTYHRLGRTSMHNPQRTETAMPVLRNIKRDQTSRHHRLIIIIVLGLPLRQHYSPAADVHSTAAAAPSLTCTNAIDVQLQRHTSLLKGRPMNDSVTREQSSMNKNQELTHRGSPGTTCFTRTTRISSFSQRRTTHTTGPRRPCCPS
jgi:hypothetical protein